MLEALNTCGLFLLHLLAAAPPMTTFLDCSLNYSGTSLAMLQVFGYLIVGLIIFCVIRIYPIEL